MAAKSPFDAWLRSEPFREVWVPVCQNRSPLIGPAHINGMLAQADDPAELLKSRETPSHGQGGIDGVPAGDMTQPPDFLEGCSSRSGGARFWPFAHIRAPRRRAGDRAAAAVPRPPPRLAGARPKPEALVSLA